MTLSQITNIYPADSNEYKYAQKLLRHIASIESVKKRLQRDECELWLKPNEALPKYVEVKKVKGAGIINLVKREILSFSRP